MNEAQAKRIAAEHQAGKHAGKTRLDCWACAGQLMRETPVYRTLYPERELMECRRCGCQHWKDGRCFAQDPDGWPIVREVTRPTGGFVSRMSPAETVAAVKGKGKAPEGEQKRWWTE